MFRWLNHVWVFVALQPCRGRVSHDVEALVRVKTNILLDKFDFSSSIYSILNPLQNTLKSKFSNFIFYSLVPSLPPRPYYCLSYTLLWTLDLHSFSKSSNSILIPIITGSTLNPQNQSKCPHQTQVVNHHLPRSNLASSSNLPQPAAKESTKRATTRMRASLNLRYFSLDLICHSSIFQEDMLIICYIGTFIQP
jgi:hypothetical protein